MEDDLVIEEDLIYGVPIHFIGPGMATYGLLRLGATLDRRDANAIQSIEEMQGASRDVWNDHADRVFKSYLWLLCAYELIRTLDQAFSDDPSLTSDTAAGLVREAKLALERVRIPLAKAERSRRKAWSTDFSFAMPTLTPGAGISWHVGTTTTVTRKDLQDAVMIALRALRDEAFRRHPDWRSALPQV